MRAKEEYEGQLKVLRRFDEALLKETDVITNGKLVFWIYVIIEMLVFLVPMDGNWREMKWVIWLGPFGVGSSIAYMQAYVTVTEQKKQHSLWKKCRYLPVERSVFLRSRFKILYGVQWKIFLTATVMQSAVVLLATGKWSLWTLLYTFLFAGAIPFCGCALYILRTVRK